MKKAEAVAKDGEALLKRIVGARLTSVQFVLNYLILGFDERGALTTLVWPQIRNRELRQRFGATGYRDSLCQLITRVVESATISEDEEITISFSMGWSCSSRWALLFRRVSEQSLRLPSTSSMFGDCREVQEL